MIGSLTAAFLLSNADLKYATTKALELAETSKLYDRKSGLAGIWGRLLKEWLEAVIPDTVSKEDFKTFQVALTPALTSFKLKSFKLVSGFENKADVIEACLASCHVPLFLNGRAFTEYKGEQVVDGSFWYFVTKNRETGLPLPAEVSLDEILWIDYGDDEIFMNSISGNFLSLITPSEVLDMVESGYNYMKREHFEGRLPIAKQALPNFINLPTAETVKSSLMEKKGRVADLDLLELTNTTVISRFSNIKGYALSSWKWLTTGLTATAITESFGIPSQLTTLELPDAYTVSKAIDVIGSMIPH